MRELKFRAWYSKSQSWVYFDFNRGFTQFGLSVYQELIIDGVTFYQFTGLKDKNGKEIYDGDILAQDYGGSDKSIKVVEYMTFLRNVTNSQLRLSEVIGNIYENPELI